MRCTSLAANGSDFTLSPASADIVSARGISCSGSFDMDALVLELSKPLDPGTYTLTMRTGLDGNTILDNCDNGIPVGQAIPFTVSYSGPAPFDSIAPFNCSTERLSIVFSKGIQCSSLAADASDFLIEGPYPVSITKAMANCTQGETQRIELQLSAPLTRSGTFSLRLQAGTDGNTLLDACGQSIPAGSSIPFSTYDAVSAKFDYRISSGCQADTFDLQHNTNNGVNNWVWTIDGNRQTGTPGLRWIYHDAGNKQVRLDVSNGYCSDSATVSFSLDVKLKAAFEATSTVCPEDSAFFRDQSTGGPIAWSWDFNNSRTSELQSPPAQSYRGATTDRSYYPSLTVRDNKGCVSRVTGEVRAIANCTIEVPTAFTPNGDGLNDYLYPLNAFKANKLLFRVYNRYGQLVFESRDGQHKWDGRINGLNQGTGQYAWTLEYTIEGKDKIYNRKGVTTLIR
jgi:gliding motility-associated-like protein